MFAIIDHASGEAWCDASLRMDRFAAADLLRGAPGAGRGLVGFGLTAPPMACFEQAAEAVHERYSEEER